MSLRMMTFFRTGTDIPGIQVRLGIVIMGPQENFIASFESHASTRM
jgi:hypothetical protein